MKMSQLQIINYLLNTKDSSIITKNGLTDIYFDGCKDEFNFILNHLNTYGKICDKETFFSVFRDFDSVEVNETPEFLVKSLYDDYNTDLIIDVVNKKIKPLLISGRVNEAIEQLKLTCESTTQGVGIECVDLLKDKSRFDAYIERTQDFGKYYISTGFPELDQLVGGFDREEELATIVARTNYGKSWVLLKCATAAVSQGLNVGIYSGEMSERKVGYRFDTLVGHLSNGALIHGNEFIKNDYKKYIDNLSTMFKGSCKVLTPNMISGPADVNALRMFIEKEHLDILFVDQLSLLEDVRKGKTPVEKASNISKDLKNLQVMLRVPIVSVSQQNRTTSENGVDTTQIAQSDRIGQDSTMIIFIEKKDDTMKLTLVKSRDSENGKVLTYHVDLNKGIFTYIPSEDDGIGGKSTSQEGRFVEVTSESVSGDNVF